MVQSIAAKEVTLAQLKEKFGLQVVRDAEFFTEWMQPQVPLTVLYLSVALNTDFLLLFDLI